MSVALKKMKEDLVAQIARAQAINEAAAAENRELTPEEVSEQTTILDATDTLESNIARQERLDNKVAKLDEPGKRRTSPEDVPPKNSAGGAAGARVTGGEDIAAASKTGGFRSFGEFARSTIAACRKTSAEVDPRLRALNAREREMELKNAASVSSSEGVGSDGGYLVPPEWRTELLQKVQGEDSLLPLTMQIDIAGNAVTFPSDENTPWDYTNGPQAYWAGEGVAPTQSKAAIQQVQARTNKLIALCPVTDELLQDGVGLESYLRTKVPEKIDFRVNDGILNGSGNGMPYGLVTSANASTPSVVTVAKESGQASATFVYANLVKMWARMPARNRRNAVWIINQDLEPQLDQMVVTGTSSVGFPAYLPAGGASNSRFDTLRGRRVLYSEACQALGTPGDIILADMSQYLSVVKAGGVRTDVSMHLFFDTDTMAFRFILRMGGLPWWKTTIARKNSSNTFGWAVVLAAR